MGIDPSKHFGCRVLKVNEMPAKDYIEGYIREEKSVLVLDEAFSRAVWNYNRWEMSYGTFASTSTMPSKSYLTLEIEFKHKPKTIWAPYLTISPRNFKDKTTFVQNNCQETPLVGSSRTVPNSPDFSHLEPILKRSTIAAFEFKGSLVIKIQDFHHGSIPNTFNDIKFLLSRNPEKIIFDLSDNVKQYRSSCGAYRLLRELFGINETFDFKMNSTLTDEPGFSRSLGSSPGIFSNDSVAKVVFVTNGICYYACALFIHGIREFSDYRLIKLGPPGALASNPDSSPFYINQVSELYSTRNDPLVKGQLFIMGQLYLSPKSDKYLKSSPPTADVNVPYTNLDPADMWERILSII